MDKFKTQIKKALLKAMRKQVYATDPERRFVSTPKWSFDLEHFFNEEERTSLYYELKAVASSTMENDIVNTLWRTCTLETQEACTETGLMIKALNDGKLTTCSIIQPENSRYCLLPTDQLSLARVITQDQYELQYTSKHRPVKVWLGDRMVGLIMPVLQGAAEEAAFADKIKRTYYLLY